MDASKCDSILDNKSASDIIYKPGMAHIKPEFIKLVDNNHENKIDNDEESNEPSAKRQKIRGMNKNRSSGHIPNQKNGSNIKKLCPYIKSSEECPYKDQCRYEHNTEMAFKEKKVNMEGECYNFSIRGFCPMGIMCFWSASHVNSDGENIRNEERSRQYVSVKNGLSKDLLTQLRKKKYNFKDSYESLDKLNISYGGRKDSGKNEIVKCEEITKEIVNVKEIKNKVDWNNKLYLAPLTTLGNLPFRRICKEFGADVTCSEMAMATKLIQGVQSEWALLKRHPSEDVFGVQICGSHPELMTKCAQLVSESCDVDFIDVNCGCPIDLVCDKGEGCGLLRNKRRMENIVSGMSTVTDCPITVKTRVGYNLSDRTTHALLPTLRDAGASMVALHGRTKEQRYTKQADWAYVNECAEGCSPMPVYGNGDILSYEDYVERKDGVAGVMIGRGALIKPWIFTEIKEGRSWDISSVERLDILRRYVNYGLEYWGSDYRGVETTRKFLLEWMSFLHRYIPVGLLQHPPQKINERPPIYFGRDDLETLMISDNCADWIKISEMLLGPVPEGFQFVPKHRANAYNG